MQVILKVLRLLLCVIINKGDEAKQALNEYLELRPNLKTKDDYKRIFVHNSSLADILIEGLCRAGWEPNKS